MSAKNLAERQKLPIGVFDSGVGGLTVLTVLKAMFPYEDFVYVGDSANNPYGNRSVEDIKKMSLRIGDYLNSHPVKLAVVACNTIAVTAMDELREHCDFPLVEVSRGIDTAMAISPRKKIGVMATAATINSHKHQLLAEEKNSNVKFYEQACPEFAHLIEEGHISDDVIINKVDEYLDPLMTAGVDTVILGCTHFAFIKKLMEKNTGHNVVYVDPARETAEEVKRVLIEEDLCNPTREKGHVDLCFTAETEQAQNLAIRLMSPKEFTIHAVTL